MLEVREIDQALIRHLRELVDVPFTVDSFCEKWDEFGWGYQRKRGEELGSRVETGDDLPELCVDPLSSDILCACLSFCYWEQHESHNDTSADEYQNALGEFSDFYEKEKRKAVEVVGNPSLEWQDEDDSKHRAAIWEGKHGLLILQQARLDSQSVQEVNYWLVPLSLRKFTPETPLIDWLLGWRQEKHRQVRPYDVVSDGKRPRAVWHRSLWLRVVFICLVLALTILLYNYDDIMYGDYKLDKFGFPYREIVDRSAYRENAVKQTQILPPERVLSFIHQHINYKIRKDGMINLSDPEIVVHFVPCFSGCQRERGLRDFFYQPMAGHTNTVVQGLREMGSKQTYEIYRELVALFPDGTVPETMEERMRAIREIDKKKLNELNQKLGECKENLDPLLVDYIRKHPDGFMYKKLWGLQREIEDAKCRKIRVHLH